MFIAPRPHLTIAIPPSEDYPVHPVPNVPDRPAIPSALVAPATAFTASLSPGRFIPSTAPGHSEGTSGSGQRGASHPSGIPIEQCVAGVETPLQWPGHVSRDMIAAAALPSASNAWGGRREGQAYRPEHLKLSGYNDIGLVNLLQYAGSLRSLDLSECGTYITSGGIALLRQLPIVELRMENMRLGNAEAVELGEIHTLRRLLIGGNQIPDAGAMALTRNTRLTELNISFNSLGPAGVIALADHPAIITLDVSGNHLNLDAVEALAANSRLTGLLMGNSVSRDQNEFLAITRSRSITHIEFDWSTVSDASMAMFANEARFRFISFSNCSLSGNHLVALACNPHVTELNVCNNAIPAKILQNLAKRPNLVRLGAEECGLSESERQSITIMWRLVGHAPGQLSL